MTALKLMAQFAKYMVVSMSMFISLFISMSIHQPIYIFVFFVVQFLHINLRTFPRI